jgi:two-component system, LuxR family, response regulator FixJ
MPTPGPHAPVVHVVDDDPDVRDSLRMLIETTGHRCATYESAEAFLARGASPDPGCALIDIRMPGMDGLALQKALKARGSTVPIVFLTGFGDVSVAVEAMKGGAVDFVEKPCARDLLLAAIGRALAVGEKISQEAAETGKARALVGSLTPREHDVLRLMVAGKPNKVIAHELQISPRTVEIHRARVMDKLAVRSLSEALKIALAADVDAHSE